MRDYESWSFWDKSFLWALAVSVLWHLFWFFSITITVSSHQKVKPRPKLVSIGAVLDDTIFKTLVENRPQLSQAFYRPLSDFSSKLEPEVKTIERFSPGDVVSVPFRKKFADSLRELIGGPKSSPEYEITPQLKADGLGLLTPEEVEPCEDKKDFPCPKEERP